MHAFLIVGNNPEKEISSRIAMWKISPWDIHRPAGAGIADIRALCRDLSLCPRGTDHVGIIEHMELLTPEAQNALLKTLEEPPPHTYMIGTTHMPEALLPTVRSRMSVITVKDTGRVSDTEILQKLLRESPGKQLSTLEPFLTTRDDAKNLVASLLDAAHEELVSHPSPRLTKLIRNLITAQSQLSVNVNPRLVVDNAVL
jgi:hypothetical protein